jgi:DNA replication protein DnaC
MLDFLAGKENVVLLDPPGTGKTHLSIRPGDPRLPRRPPRPVSDGNRMVALLADAQRHGRLDSELDRLQRVPLLVVDEVDDLDPHAASLMFMLVKAG